MVFRYCWAVLGISDAPRAVVTRQVIRDAWCVIFGIVPRTVTGHAWRRYDAINRRPRWLVDIFCVRHCRLFVG